MRNDETNKCKNVYTGYTSQKHISMRDTYLQDRRYFWKRKLFYAQHKSFTVISSLLQNVSSNSFSDLLPSVDCLVCFSTFVFISDSFTCSLLFLCVSLHYNISNVRRLLNRGLSMSTSMVEDISILYS